MALIHAIIILFYVLYSMYYRAILHHYAIILQAITISFIFIPVYTFHHPLFILLSCTYPSFFVWPSCVFFFVCSLFPVSCLLAGLLFVACLFASSIVLKSCYMVTVVPAVADLFLLYYLVRFTCSPVSLHFFPLSIFSPLFSFSPSCSHVPFFSFVGRGVFGWVYRVLVHLLLCEPSPILLY